MARLATAEPPFECAECGRSASPAEPVHLAALGWKLLRRRDSYGNPVLSWRCPRCDTATAARRMQSGRA